MALAIRCDTTARYAVAAATSSTKNIASKFERVRIPRRHAHKMGPPRVMLDCAFAHVNRLVGSLDIILEVRNVGSSAARKINFTLEGTALSADSTQSTEQALERNLLRQLVLLQKPVYNLAPGGRVAVLLGAFVPTDLQLDLLTTGDSFAVRAQYQDEANNNFREEILIDLKTWDGMKNPGKTLNSDSIFKTNFEKLTESSEHLHQYAFKDQNLIHATSVTPSVASKRAF